MSSWVISSNPETYNVEDYFNSGKEYVDWATVNNFRNGDIVYIYEVAPPRGRGGIIYKTKVIKTGFPFLDKLDDETYWNNNSYPSNLFSEKFSRLRLEDEQDNIGLKLSNLKEHGFHAPQGKAHLLDNNKKLLSYIEFQFSN